MPGALLLAAALAYWGWWSYRNHGFSVYVAARWVLAVLIGPLWAPTLLIDELRVDEEQMTWNAGFWWSKEERTIRYASVGSVTVERRKRFRHTETVWVMRMLNGSVNEVVVTDLWREHYDEVKARFQAKGVPFPGDA
jgi:hypothetical protein